MPPYQSTRRESEPVCHEFQALSPYGPHTTGHYRWPTQGNYRKTAGKVNHISTNRRHFPLWSIHYRALQVAHTRELPENHKESEPIYHESQALSPYGPHTTRHYRWPTQGNYRKTTGKVNQISTNQRHFPGPGYIPVQRTYIVPNAKNQVHFPRK